MHATSGNGAAPAAPRTPEVGVLALQGGFTAHVRALARLGVAASEVRRPAELPRLDGLIVPGGESSTLLKLMAYEPAWWPSLEAFRSSGGAILGTCAGLILVARQVTNPPQRSLGFLDVAVSRNAYGRQIDSFTGHGSWHDGSSLEMVFIRAPRITDVGPGVSTLAVLDGEPVLVGDERVLGATFHPELTEDDRVHRAFLAMVAPRPGEGPGPPTDVPRPNDGSVFLERTSL